MANSLIFEAPQIDSDGGSGEVGLVEIVEAITLVSLSLDDEDFATAIAGLVKISGLPGGGIGISWRNAEVASGIGERFSQALYAALDL
jgi:hypothetical protein